MSALRYVSAPTDQQIRTGKGDSDSFRRRHREQNLEEYGDKIPLGSGDVGVGLLTDEKQYEWV